MSLKFLWTQLSKSLTWIGYYSDCNQRCDLLIQFWLPVSDYRQMSDCQPVVRIFSFLRLDSELFNIFLFKYFLSVAVIGPVGLYYFYLNISYLRLWLD